MVTKIGTRLKVNSHLLNTQSEIKKEMVSLELVQFKVKVLKSRWPNSKVGFDLI
jgi:hypothetical protein